MATATNNEKRFYQLTLAIQKAINSIETPVKEKHVRSTIIGTFQEQSAITYWMVAIRLPLQDNRIVAWKFCHVTHKLLREGHPACLDDSQRHIAMIENLGKLWVHLREGYGKLVHLYCSLLVCKLKFHARNPRFPGHLQLTADELDAIAENDVNNYFQLCVELFDYMDEILNLQEAVFDSLGNARANSMTASGQCRLAALIPCAQDSSQVYDCNVRLLFRLHAALPADTLAGHRDRFRQQFKKLSSFYKHASSLQYYRNLLTLPVLPSNPPNFLLQSDFGTYVAPVVTIPDLPPDEVDAVGSLIDTSDTMSQNQSQARPAQQVTYPESELRPLLTQENEQHRMAPTPDSFEARASPSPQPDPVVERDRLIDHLQNELKRMRNEASQMVQERNTMLGSMREHCTRLEAQLNAVKAEAEQEKHKAEMLMAQTPEIKQKLAETEEKAKVTDEKFQKLKGAYTQLREEHITLIRQKAEVDKLSASLRAAAAQHESAKAALQQQLNDRMKDVELLQQSASSSEEIEAYKSEILNLRTELEQSRQKEIELETIRASMEALEIENRTAKTETQEKLNTLSNELKETTEALEMVKKEKLEMENELSKVKEELTGLREKSSDQFAKALEEKEAAVRQVAELLQQHQQEKEEQMLDNNKVQAKLDDLQLKLINADTDFRNQCDRLKEELSLKNLELENVVNNKDIELQEALDKLEVLQKHIEITKNTYELKLQEQSKEIEVLKSEVKEKANLTCVLEQELDDSNKKIKNLEESLHENNDSKIVDLNKKIYELNIELNNYKAMLENQKTEAANNIKEKTIENAVLNDKLKNIIECKDEIIANLKSMVTEKDHQVIALNVEVTKLSENVLRLEEELTETQAELEIGRNEFISLKEEHDDIVNRNESNIVLKNRDMRHLHDEISQLKAKNMELISNNEKQIVSLNSEKQVLEKAIKEQEAIIEKLRAEHSFIVNEKETTMNKLNETIEILQIDNERLKTLCEKMEEQENNFNLRLCEKDDGFDKIQEENVLLKSQLAKIQNSETAERQDLDELILGKEKETQMLEARLQHADSKRLNAECELQDLLQHNTVLETDLASLKKQLEEAKEQLQKQSGKIVSCASEAAMKVTQGALSALEAGGAQELNVVASQLAAEALEELAKHTQVQGNEESVARSAILAAHNTAQMTSYVSELANASTDMELSEKVNSDCKSLLSETQQWLSALRDGRIESASVSKTLGAVESVARSVGTAPAPNVDDELAGMDRAIEEAAAKIEAMLVASRAADSGLKLEVNGKILDACTTLMSAVKVLVEDARELQNELGDPTTREKMYRKNPQWSQGLISAAKSVVFAAKLLVTSADEAVGACGRVEGVCAAATEVSGSTAQLVAASRARAPPHSARLARLTAASRAVAPAVAALLAAARAAAHAARHAEALDTSALTLTATRRLEMESKVRSLELETALEAERVRLAALRKRHYHLAQQEENGNMTNGKE